MRPGLICRPGPFLPTSLANCVLWLRPDAGQVTLNGSTASQVADRGSLAATASQATAVLQPTWTAAGTLNGQPCLTFNGATWMQLAANLPTGARTVLAVLRWTSTTGVQIPVSLKTGGSTFVELASIVSASYPAVTLGDDFLSASVVGYGGYSTAVNTAGHSILHTWDGASVGAPASYAIFDAGVAQTTQTAATLGHGATDLSSIGASVTSAQVASSQWHGELYDLAVWSRVLTSTELVNVQAYSVARYGL